MASAADGKEIEFGTDGWRGRIGRDFTFPNVRKVAQAIADFLKTPKKQMPVKLAWGPNSPIIIGYDRRFRSDAFAREIAQVLAANKLKPVLTPGPVPTPAVSLATGKQNTVGIMVTASHNPADYNGVKLKVEGAAAPPELTKAVEAKLGGAFAGVGGDVPVKPIAPAYIAYLKGKAPVSKILAGLKKPVVVDYMYGSGGGTLEAVLGEKKLVVLHGESDPTFKGLHPEPIERNLEELKDAVKKHKALVGLALDGDGDRLGVVDEKGRYLTPCQVAPMLLEYLLAQRKVKGKVLQSVSMGYLCERVAKAHGLEFAETPVGFKHIAEKMRLNEVAFGAEESGGYGWLGGPPERDGALAALLFLEMLVVTKKSPSELLAAVEKKHGRSVFVRVDFKIAKPVEKAAFVEKLKKRLPTRVGGDKIKEAKDLDGIKVYMEKDGWVLMRPSGTEPLIRTYAESSSEKNTEALLDAAKKWVRGHI